MVDTVEPLGFVGATDNSMCILHLHQTCHFSCTT